MNLKRFLGLRQPKTNIKIKPQNTQKQGEKMLDLKHIKTKKALSITKIRQKI